MLFMKKAVYILSCNFYVPLITGMCSVYLKLSDKFDDLVFPICTCKFLFETFYLPIKKIPNGLWMIYFENAIH